MPVFKDTAKHWARGQIERAAKLGLLAGYPDGTFRPDHPISRAEVAVIALRLYGLAKEMFDDLVAEVEPAVVTVTNPETGALGSGSSIGRGYVLTNAHVVLNQEGKTTWHYAITWTDWGYGEEGQARYAEGPCVFAAPEVDLAIVRADIAHYRQEMPALPLGDPSSVRRGMPVLVCGSPLGYAGTVTQGIVSYVGRNMEYEIAPGVKAKIADAIQTDAAINPGNSGGAMVNREGKLIGVPSLKLVHLAVEGMGFAIGLQTVLEAIRRAEQAGALAAAHKVELLAAFKEGGLSLA